MLQLVMAKDYLELQLSELRHHSASHAQDDSKKLKYEQMLAIRDAVVTPWEHWALSSERCVGSSRQPLERRT